MFVLDVRRNRHAAELVLDESIRYVGRIHVFVVSTAVIATLVEAPPNEPVYFVTVAPKGCYSQTIRIDDDDHRLRDTLKIGFT